MKNIEETIFDRILRGEIPVDKVYEDETVLAFHDIQPQAKVHVLVIPKKRLNSFADLAEFEPAQYHVVADLFCKTALVARKLGLDADGYRIVSNHGQAAHQSVFYLHLHILGGELLAKKFG